jgi:hypothetical protein
MTPSRVQPQDLGAFVEVMAQSVAGHLTLRYEFRSATGTLDTVMAATHGLDCVTG